MPSKTPILWGGDLEVATLRIYDPDLPGLPLGADDRKQRLERMRGGEAVTLAFQARTFVQRETPNRNYLRFAPKSLTKLGRSFKGVPFLKDHDQRRIEARGGTVLESTVERGDDGAVAFVQSITLSKAWAVEALLDGTIDRFSIGFVPTGPILCSVHRTPIFKECACWPGDRTAKSEERVEFVFTEAEGVEVSAVNVPAVIGTGIDDIRSALSAFADDPPREPELLEATRAMTAIKSAQPGDGALALLAARGFDVGQVEADEWFQDLRARTDAAAARRVAANSAAEFAARPDVRAMLHAMGLDDAAIDQALSSGSLDAFMRQRGAL
jgi:phage head maturation protease